MFAINVCLGGNILFDGPRFSPKPNSSVTLTVWIKLIKNNSRQTAFATIGDNASTHNQGHYILEIIGGRVHWLHRKKRKVTIFSVKTMPLIKIGEWTHLAVTYDGRIPKVG